MKFRKKPVVIEAIQIGKDMTLQTPDWFKEALLAGTVKLHGMSTYTRDEPYVEIETLEGVMRGNRHDWIIRGVQGELYPCRSDIFEQTYEQVEE